MVVKRSLSGRIINQFEMGGVPFNEHEYSSTVEVECTKVLKWKIRKENME